MRRRILRKILTFLKPYRKHLVVGPAFKLAEAILELLIPLMIAHMIDAGIAQKDHKLIWTYGLLTLLMAVAGLAFASVCQYAASLASQGFGTDLRTALFRHINHLALSHLDRIGASSLVNRLTNDVNLLQQAVAMLIRLVVRAPFLSIGGIVMAMMIDVRLSLIMLITLPLFVLIVYLIMSRTIPLYRRIQTRVDHLMRQVLENLTGIRIIRAFARRKEEKKKFDHLNHDIADLQVRVGRISNLLNPATTLILNTAIAAILWFGAFQINAGTLTQGQLIALTNYIGQILVALVVVANLVILYTRAYASASRVGEVLEMQPSEQLLHASQDNALPSVNALRSMSEQTDMYDLNASDWLRFEQVQFQYPNASEPLFDALDFSTGQGRMLGLIGPTGAGKSTLAWLTLKIWPLQSGRIYAYGKQLHLLSPEEIRKMVTIVPQKSVLFSGTLLDNLRLGYDTATEEKIWEALEAAQAAEFVGQLKDGLLSRVNRGGSNFSGGQRQRLAIARALIANPQILILDDSTSALDYATEAALYHSLMRFAGGKLKLMVISQRIASIQRADHILVLEDGDLVAAGSHLSLMETSTLYQEIWESQQQNGGGR